MNQAAKDILARAARRAAREWERRASDDDLNDEGMIERAATEAFAGDAWIDTARRLTGAKDYYETVFMNQLIKRESPW